MNNKCIVFLSVLLYHVLFINIDDGSGIGRKVQVVLLAIVCIMLMFSGTMSFNHLKGCKSLNTIFFIYVLSIAATSISIKDITYRSMQSLDVESGDVYNFSSYTLGFFYVIAFPLFLIFCEYIAAIGRKILVVKTFLRITLFYCILLDVYCLLLGGELNDVGFSITNKFTISYMHMFCAILYWTYMLLTDKWKRMKCLYFLIFSAVISILVQCSTGLIGSLVLIMCLMYEDFFYNKVTYSTTAIAVTLTICSTLLISFSSVILSNNYVSYIIEDILGKDATLTGRTSIYDVLWLTISLRPWLGWGVGNGHGIMMFSYGMANAQNGLFNLVLEQGIVGAVAFILLLMKIILLQKGNLYKRYTYPILTLVFAMIVISCVEITFDTVFISYLLFSIILFTPNKSTDNAH